MRRKRLIAICLAMLSMASIAHSREQCPDIDICVNKAILDAAAFIDACSILYPTARLSLREAFANWVVLSLPIPGLEATLRPDNKERGELRAEILTYLKRIPGYESDIECSGRWEMMVSKEPRLLSDRVYLAPGTLSRYQK